MSNGAPPGGDDDILIMRLFRRIATPASETLDGEVRQELAVAVTALWFVAGAGEVVGYGVGYGLWAVLPSWLAIVSCGFFQLVGALIVYAYLPETAPSSKPFSYAEALDSAMDRGPGPNSGSRYGVARWTRSTYLTASYVLHRAFRIGGRRGFRTTDKI